MEVSAIKMATGEEFIAATVELTDGKVEVTDPVTIMQNPNDGRASFAPWFAFSATRKFTFKPEQLLLVEPAGKEVVDGYKQAFGLIQTPPEKKIIT